MVNMSVPHRRPNYALQTLVEEVKAAYGQPSQLIDYVTGYKSPTNITSHNADANGIIHGADLFFKGGNWTEDRGWALAEWLRSVEGPKGAIPGHPDRMYYIIYRDRIAGDFTGWEWSQSGYAHWDHIHISTVDLYWGDQVLLPADDYDSTAPWGFRGSLNPAGNNTPIIIKEDDMTADMKLISKDGSEVTLNQLLNSLDKKTQESRDAAALLPALDRDLRGRLKALLGFETDVRNRLALDAAVAAESAARIGALTNAVTALATATGSVDPAAILATVEAGMDKFRDSYQVTLERVNATDKEG